GRALRLRSRRHRHRGRPAHPRGLTRWIDCHARDACCGRTKLLVRNCGSDSGMTDAPSQTCGPEPVAQPVAHPAAPAAAPGEGRRPAGWRQKLALYLLCDLGLAGGRDPVQLVGPALAAGVRAVQLRAKATPDRVAYQLALALRRLTARYDALLIINDRVDLAL